MRKRSNCRLAPEKNGRKGLLWVCRSIPDSEGQRVENPDEVKEWMYSEYRNERGKNDGKLQPESDLWKHKILVVVYIKK